VFLFINNYFFNKMVLTNKELILASKSPRRSQLLTEAGYTFAVFTKDVDETVDENMAVEGVAAHLAQRKARACAEVLTTPNKVLLSADSVVILNGIIYGKPENYEGGVLMLRALSGQMHYVITGVCLLSQSKEVVFSDITKVYFKELSEEVIHYYLTNYAPYDKAGSYGIQDWIGLTQITKIEGTYSNVMGLPVERVYKELLAF
jgi:septum formation protein